MAITEEAECQRCHRILPVEQFDGRRYRSRGVTGGVRTRRHISTWCLDCREEWRQYLATKQAAKNASK